MVRLRLHWNVNWMLSSAWRRFGTKCRSLLVVRADSVLGPRFCHKMAEEVAEKMTQMGVEDDSGKIKAAAEPSHPLEVSRLLG